MDNALISGTASSLPGRLRLTEKLRQRTLWPAAIRVANGNVLDSPIVVDLDPTTVCDLACPECISVPVLNKGGFTANRLDSLAIEIADAGVRAVVLIGGGEPLAHSGISRVIQTLTSRGLHVGLVTNGTLLGHHLDVIASKIDWVRVSIDAATAATYQRIRPSRKGPNMFPRVLRNMLRLSRRRTGALGYSFLALFREDAEGRIVFSNLHEIARAARIAKRLGCDYFELKAALDMNHYIIDPSKASLELISRELSTATMLEDQHFAVLVSSSMAALLKREDRVQNKQYQRCSVAELRTLITPTGVYVCPYHRGNPKFQIGDAVKNSFKQIWDAANRGVVNPQHDCLFHCARHESNLALTRAIDGAAEASVVEDYDLFL